MQRLITTVLACAMPVVGALADPSRSDGQVSPTRLAANSNQWRPLTTRGEPSARHEADFVALGDRLYLVGGRRTQPTDEYHPLTSVWRALAPPPLELHHLQALPRAGELWIVSALTGPFPNETPIDRVYRFDPRADRWTAGAVIPAERRRGGAGVVEHRGLIYVVGGIQRGHRGGFVPWLDRFDPLTGDWTPLTDAPHARDHFQAAVIGSRIYCAGGRQTSQETGELMSRTLAPVDVYDLDADRWTTLEANLPTPRAGTASVAIDGRLVVTGGESMSQQQAHNETEVYDPATGRWTSGPPLARGRHGSGTAVWRDRVFIASGSTGRGGGPELTTIEAIARAALR